MYNIYNQIYKTYRIISYRIALVNKKQIDKEIQNEIGSNYLRIRSVAYGT